MENVNPLVNYLDSKPSCLKGKPKFIMSFREEDLEEEVEEEFEEEKEEDDLEYFNTFSTRVELEYHGYLLKKPCPSWIRAKVRTRNVSNIKIPCMIVYFLKEQTYIDLESPVNIMSRIYYYWIANEGLELRKKPSNPNKTCNFVGRVRGVKVFMGNFTYECDLMVLEDVSSVIDRYLGGMILGKPFINSVQRIKNEAKRLGTRWQVRMAALEARLVARTPEPTMNHLEAHVASSDRWIRNNTVVGSRANDWHYH
ncbi:hypothetical protein Tco_1570111 [Tanacetum coccineum]